MLSAIGRILTLVLLHKETQALLHRAAHEGVTIISRHLANRIKYHTSRHGAMR